MGIVYLRLVYTIYAIGCLYLLLKAVVNRVFEKNTPIDLYFIPIWPLAILSKRGRLWLIQFKL